MEVPLPGLADAQSVLAIPLAIGDRLIGVLSAEDRDPMRFGEWHEAYLEKLRLDPWLARGQGQPRKPPDPAPPAAARKVRRHPAHAHRPRAVRGAGLSRDRIDGTLTDYGRRSSSLTSATID